MIAAMKLLKAMATVAGLTGLSRIAGFIRDILTASILGAGPIADAFFVALKLPNLFRRITAEGAFTVSFVPLYSEALEKEGQDKADRFASNALSVMAIGLALFSAAAMLLMPFIITLIAPGFEKDGPRYDLAVTLAQITFPYLLLMSMTALFGGVLNAHERFAPFAAAPILFNLSLIGFLLLSFFFFPTAGHAMAWGVFAAGLLQCALLWWNVKRQGYKIGFIRPQWDGRLKQLFLLMGPGIIGAGVVQINLFADMIIASFLDTGSISFLYYADRLNQLPLGMIGIAIGTTLLPMLSRALSSGQGQDARDLFNRALEICLVIGLPSAVGLFLIAQPVITMLFERGAFDGADTVATAAVLKMYVIGLPAYVITKVYSAAFWARKNTTTPVKISIFGTVLNIALGVTFIFVLGTGVEGIALATSIAGWVQLLCFGLALRSEPDMRLEALFYSRMARVLVSVAVMAAVIIGLDRWLLSGADVHLIVAVLSIILGAQIVYGGAILLTGAVKIEDVKRVLKRKK